MLSSSFLDHQGEPAKVILFELWMTGMSLTTPPAAQDASSEDIIVYWGFLFMKELSPIFWSCSISHISTTHEPESNESATKPKNLRQKCIAFKVSYLLSSLPACLPLLFTTVIIKHFLRSLHHGESFFSQEYFLQQHQLNLIIFNASDIRLLN